MAQSPCGGGRVKVLDLGLGALMEAERGASFATAAGHTVGTVDYMSPEQATGRDLDGRSDLFGLGCTMYHLLTGRVPFPGETTLERLTRRVQGQPVPVTEVLPDLPPLLPRVLDTLLARRPEDRFQTAAEAAHALLGVLGGPAEVGGPTPPASTEDAPPPAAEPAGPPLPAPEDVPPPPPPHATDPAASSPPAPPRTRLAWRPAGQTPLALLTAFVAGFVLGCLVGLRLFS